MKLDPVFDSSKVNFTLAEGKTTLIIASFIDININSNYCYGTLKGPGYISYSTGNINGYGDEGQKILGKVTSNCFSIIEEIDSSNPITYKRTIDYIIFEIDE